MSFWAVYKLTLAHGSKLRKTDSTQVATKRVEKEKWASPLSIIYSLLKQDAILSRQKNWANGNKMQAFCCRRWHGQLAKQDRQAYKQVGVDVDLTPPSTLPLSSLPSFSWCTAHQASLFPQDDVAYNSIPYSDQFVPFFGCMLSYLDWHLLKLGCFIFIKFR